jgi:uncharacterized protein (DUF427 family)/quinol monooxygenase YgiN
MTGKPIKQPGPDHPITIERNPARVVVSVAGLVIADTQDALTLHEAGHQPVQYIPLIDVDMSLLKPTDHATYCPYKGDCNYYSIPAGGEKSVNAAWTYKTPFPAVAQIKDHIAFYPDRVDEMDATDNQLGDHRITPIDQRVGMSDPELILVAEVHGRAALRDELRAALSALADGANGEPGCIGFRVLSGDDPGEFVLLASWTSEEALRKHYTTAHYRRYREHVGPLLTRPSDVVIHRLTETVHALDPNPPDPGKLG